MILLEILSGDAVPIFRELLGGRHVGEGYLPGGLKIRLGISEE